MHTDNGDGKGGVGAGVGVDVRKEVKVDVDVGWVCGGVGFRVGYVQVQLCVQVQV